MPMADVVGLIGIGVSSSGLISAFIAAYVGLKNRALMAELKRDMAELENKVLARMNGTYVRANECKIREELIMSEIKRLVGSGWNERG